MKKISFLLALMLIGLSPVYALEVKDITREKKGNETYYSFKKEYNDYSEAEKDLSEFEKYVLNEKGIVTYKNITTNETANKFKLVNGVLYADDIETLNEKQQEIESNYQDTEIVKYEITFGDVVTIETVTTSDIEDSGTIGKYSSEEEANAAKENAESNNSESFKLTCTIVEDKEFVETKVAEISQTFDTEEEAANAIESLRSQGYDVTNIQINGITVTINGEDETKENEDKTVLENYVSSLIEQGWNVTYEYSTREDVTGTNVTQIYQSFDDFASARNYANELHNIFDHVDVEVLDESYKVENTEDINETFNTEAEAENRAQELINQGYTLSDNTITENQTLTNTETKTIENEVFTSEEEANARLSSLEQEGWSVVSKNIQKMTSEEIITSDIIETIINQDQELDNGNYTYGHLDISSTNQVSVKNSDGTFTTVTGEIALTSVKLNGNTVAMHSQATTDPGRQTLEFMSRSRNMSFGNNSIIEITGTLTYTYNGEVYTLPISVNGILNEANNICEGYWGHSGHSGGTRGYDAEFSEIKVQDGKVIVDTNYIETYKLNASLEKNNYTYSYTLNAKATKEETVAKYTVSGEASNDVTSLINILNLSKTKDVTKYKADGQATMDIYNPVWFVNYTSIQTIYNTIYSYSVDYEINETDINKTYTAEAKGKRDEIPVPKTGINEFRYEYLIILSAICLLVVNIKFAYNNIK